MLAARNPWWASRLTTTTRCYVCCCWGAEASSDSALNTYAPGFLEQAIVDDVIDYDYAPIAILVCHNGISKMVSTRASARCSTQLNDDSAHRVIPLGVCLQCHCFFDCGRVLCHHSTAAILLSQHHHLTINICTRRSRRLAGRFRLSGAVSGAIRSLSGAGVLRLARVSLRRSRKRAGLLRRSGWIDPILLLHSIFNSNKQYIDTTTQLRCKLVCWQRRFVWPAR